MTVDPQRLHAAWGNFLGDFDAQFAVTVAYNPHHLGTADRCYRFSSDGECLPVRGSGIVSRYGINRVAGTRFIPLEQVHRDLDRLHARVDRTLFGKRFNTFPEAKRTAFVGLIEHPQANLHAHLCWRVPDMRADEFAAVVSAAWRATGPSRTIDVQPIRDSGWAHYTVKHQYGAALNDAALFIASRAARS